MKGVYMYCIKCGVELSDSEKKCPICRLVPYHPELTREIIPPKYPEYTEPKKHVNRKTTLFVVTILMAVAAIQIALCDIMISGSVTWSSYASGGLILTYVLAILPLWFKHPNPVIFVPCDFVAVGLYIAMVNLITGGDWFVSFALPAVGIAGIIITTVVTLRRYVRGGFFFIYGGALIAGGVYVSLIELFIHITFDIGKFFYWSFYPLTGCVLLGLAMLIIGICRPIREALEKKFFI